MEQLVQGAIAHELCDYAEELGLVADAEDLDDVVEPGFVKHLGLLQQTFPLSETQLVLVSLCPQMHNDLQTAIKIPQILTVFYQHEARDSHKNKQTTEAAWHFQKHFTLRSFSNNF